MSAVQEPASAPATDRPATRRLLSAASNLLRRLRHGPLPEPALATPYQTAVAALAAARGRIAICIVGANDGRINDPVHDLVRRHLGAQTDMILFEPQTRLHPHLAESYAFHPSVTISAAAVGAPGRTVLHAIHPDHWARARPWYAAGWPDWRAPTGVTSLDRDHVLAWVRKYLPHLKDPASALERLEVDCAPLPALLAGLGRPPRIDVLQIDAEGADDTVIYNADLARTRPGVILAEVAHLDTGRRDRLFAHLTGHGYLLGRSQRDLLAIARAAP
jgi:FkbM family methyltransferase